MSYNNDNMSGSVNRAGFRIDVDQFDRAKSSLGLSYVLASSGVAVPLTGTTVETVLASVLIPGGLLGPNGCFRLVSLWSVTNSVNNKTCRHKFGAITCATHISTTVSQIRMSNFGMNRGNEASQVFPAGSASFSDTTTAAVVATSAVDTTVDQTVYLSGALSLSTEMITLEAWMLEVMPD